MGGRSETPKTKDGKPSEARPKPSFIVLYPLSVAAASIAEISTYPVDLTKTRLQLQGEVAAGEVTTKRMGSIATAVSVVKNEGFFKLWSGLTAGLMRHAVYTGTRVVVYENLRDHVLKREPDGTFSVWKSSLAGVSAGAFAQFVANPTDMVKVQYQMEGKRILMGKKPRYRNVFHAFFAIYKKGGVVTLWKGAVPNMYRSALVNLGDLTAYDWAKQLMITKFGFGDNYVTHFSASMYSGLVGAILGSPADLIRARVMNQPVDEKGRGILYKSMTDCIVKTWKNEGPLGFYKGFLPLWFRLGPWIIVFWLSMEKFRDWAGVEGF